MQTENNRASHTKNFSTVNRWGQPDPDSILRDLLHQWWMVVLSALAGALLLGALMISRYTPTYTSTTTFAIGTTGYANSSYRIYTNYVQASTTTSQFSQVISSSILRSQVCERLGVSSLNAQISVSTVSSTNLMVLTVTAYSPSDAYFISCAVKEEAVELMDYFLDGVTLMEIQNTNVPDSVTSPLNLVHYMRYGLVAGAGGMLLLLILLSCMRGTVKNRDDMTTLVDAKLLGTIGYEKKGKAGAKAGKLSMKARREQKKRILF